MRRCSLRRVSALAALACATTTGCQAFLVLDERVVGERDASAMSNDAALADGGATTPDSAIADGGGDEAAAPDAGPCPLILDEKFDPVGGAWLVSGDARIEAGVATITPDGLYQKGALWLRIDPPVSKIGIELRFLVSNALSGRGSGIAVAWAPPLTDGGAPGLGDNGESLALCLLDGPPNATALALYTNEQSSIQFLDVTAHNCTPGNSSSVTFAPDNKVTVEVDGIALKATVSGSSNALVKMNLQQSRPIGWIGLTGATTQDQSALHQVDDVIIRACQN